MSGYNLSTPLISSACTKELINKDADSVLQFLMQQTTQLTPHDPLQTIYINKVEKRCKDVADEISKHILPCSNKGKPPVCFSDNGQHGHPNTNVYC
jgi:hypothetical protein